MSVKRLVATMDTAGVNVSAFCAQHGMSRDSFYKIRDRYLVEGESGLEPRSRAPKTVANKTPAAVEDEIVRIRKELTDKGLDAGAITIQWHLEQGDIESVPHVATIWRILKARGFVVADPSKAPKTKSRSFQADRANEVWQIDGTDWALADNSAVKIINIIDDGSRVCPASVVHGSETHQAAWATFLSGANEWGMPARFLSDNGKGLVALGESLAGLGISMGHSRPYHPQTCGKVERFHQTLKKWLKAHQPCETPEELQTLLDEFRTIYNHERPHRGIGRKIPANQWDTMAKAGPKDRPLTTANPSIGTRTVNESGIVYYANNIVSLGRVHTGHEITVISSATHIHMFHNTKLIRHLELTPNTNRYPLHTGPGRPRKTR